MPCMEGALSFLAAFLDEEEEALEVEDGLMFSLSSARSGLLLGVDLE